MPLSVHTAGVADAVFLGGRAYVDDFSRKVFTRPRASRPGTVKRAGVLSKGRRGAGSSGFDQPGRLLGAET